MKFKRLLIIITFVLLLTACGKTTPPLDPTPIDPSDDYIYYEVIFDSQGGSEVSSQRVLANNPVVRPGNPTRANYSFIGWYKTTTFTKDDLWNFGTDTVTKDITLYASWKEVTEAEKATSSLTYRLIDGGYEVTGVGDEERIIIPDTYNGETVIRIGNSAFARKQITYVSIPDSVVSIGLNAFNNASLLKEVIITENSKLASIENNAFSGNSSLESIYLPSSFETLGDSVFNNAGALNSITVASNNTKFYSTGNNLIETSTQTLIRGSNVSFIPSGVKILASAAFRRSKIENITIPASVETIENYVFDDAVVLKEINVEEDNRNYSSITGVLYNKAQTELIKTPEGKVGLVDIPSTLLEIPSFAFDGITTITHFNIPKSVTNIKSFAFRNATGTIHYAGTEDEWNLITKHSTWGGNNLTTLYNSTYTDGNDVINACTIYFSATGNTKGIAERIASYTSSSLYEITAETPYTSADLNYSNSSCRANIEQNDATSRPKIGSETIDLSEYEVIYLGYPIWWGKAPKIIYTFLDTYDLSNKTIIPFCTSGGSSISESESDLHALEQNANWLDGKRFSTNASQSEINTWIDSLKISNNDLDEVNMIFATINNVKLQIDLVDNSSTKKLVEILKSTSIQYEAHDYGNFEKVGDIGYTLPQNNTDITTKAGDVILYQGTSLCFYYNTNTWSFTQIGKINGYSQTELMEILKANEGNITITLSIS